MHFQRVSKRNFNALKPQILKHNKEHNLNAVNKANHWREQLFFYFTTWVTILMTS